MSSYRDTAPLCGAVVHFVIPNVDNPYERIFPAVFTAGFATVLYSASFFFVSSLYVNLKNKLTEAKEVSLGDKIGFGLRIAIMLLIGPNFIRTLIDIVEGNIPLLIFITTLFFIPYWIIFSVIVRKMLSSYFILAMIFIVLTSMYGAVFLNAPFLANISHAYTFLTGFLGFVSALFFPAFLIGIIFIEIPNFLRIKNSNDVSKYH